MKRIGVDTEQGAVRAGIVHYNTVEEVDRLLAALRDLSE
jgi:selenocysteine lyase/cysteine desulfurase